MATRKKKVPAGEACELCGSCGAEWWQEVREVEGRKVTDGFLRLCQKCGEGHERLPVHVGAKMRSVLEE